jgi:hypothetical protein
MEVVRNSKFYRVYFTNNDYWFEWLGFARWRKGISLKIVSMGNFVCKFCFIAQVRSLNSSKSYEEGLNFQVLFVIQLLKIYFYKKIVLEDLGSLFSEAIRSESVIVSLLKN